MAQMVRRRRAAWLARALLVSSTALAAPAWAQDATWSANPDSATFGGRADYTTPGNWVGGTVPTGTATFDATSEADIFFENRVQNQHIMVGRFVFTANAPAYIFTLESDELSFTGAGIVNNSAATQTLIAGNRSTLHFANTSSAGNASLIARGGTGSISFENGSNAGTATIRVGEAGSGGGLLFRDNSNAADATITNPFGSIIFRDNSSGGNAAITNQNLTTFRDSSGIGSATITNNGLVRMFMSSNGPAGTIINNAGATVDISADPADGPSAGVSIGSLSGAGNVRLGGRNLILGALNRNETISGAISDGGDAGGTGGSLTKTGTGTLTLSGASTYTGATTVNGGTLLLTGSITGAGATAVGAGSGADGRLTIQGGGTLTGSGDAAIGQGGDGIVTVSGAGSAWTIGGGLQIGSFTAGDGSGLLNVQAGATVTSSSSAILIRTMAPVSDGRAIVDGAGSVWNTGNLLVQSPNNPTALTISDGGTVNSAAVNLAGSVLATGAGSVWNTGHLIVGPNLSANGNPAGRLMIAGGAVVNSSSAVIAEGGSFTSSVLIDGPGSAWSIGSDLVISPTDSFSGQVSVLNGGTLTVEGGTGTISVGPNGGASFFTIGGGAPGTLPGTVRASSMLIGSGSFLAFDHVSGNYLFAPLISGSGRILAGRGTTVLTADSTGFAGTTTISGGATLQLGNGGSTGALGGNIVNDGALVINRGISTLALAGIISGTGTVTQNGNPSTTVSAQNTYTGATTINGGGFFVTGSIASSSQVNVNGGGRLGGTGTVARTNVVGGGTLLPGAPIPPGGEGAVGTLSVAGNLSLTNANYVADIAPAAADRIAVDGAATLAGRLAAVAAGGAYAPGQYTLLTTTGGQSGTFGAFAIVGNFGGLSASLSYTANSVLLNLARFSATGEERWLANPATSLWNTGTNWNPADVPDGTARFGPSTRTTLTFAPGTTQIGRLLFDADAPAYAFNLDSRIISQGGGSSMNILGEGVVNNSTSRPTFFVTASARAADGGGALNFFNASSAGNARISSFNNGAGQNDFATTFYGTSTAAEALIENVGAGTAFRESSTAGDATIDNGAGIGFGGTAFFDNSNAGNATIDNEELGGLAFFDNASAAAATIVNHAISSYAFGRGSASSNVGIRFEDMSTAGGASITNDGGSTGFFDTSNAANATIVNSGSGGGLSFSTVFTENSSAGSASITNNQDGVTIFQQQGSAASSTIVNNQGGSTSFFGAASAATATITNNDGGTTRFRHSAQGGTATIVNNAGGAVDISEDPQQTPSLVSAAVAIGSLSGAGNVLLGSRTLILGGLGRDETIAGIIADGGEFGGTGGSLTKTGTGTLTLSGASSYTGATIVNGGTLLVNGSIAGSAATVNDGATLGGTGTVGTTAIADGGTLSPGNSIGTLAIAGNLAFGASSTYFVEVGPAAADRVDATGTAALAGTLNATGLGGFSSSADYTLLTAAGGVTGTFGSFTTAGDFSGFTPTLSYTANSVLLRLERSGPTNTVSTSLTDAILFNAPTVTVQQVGLFETRIIGRLAGGMALFDQTYAAAFSSPIVQNGVQAARLAVTGAGGPGVIVLASDPVLVSSTITSTTSSSSLFSLAGRADTVTTTATFGPATVTIGDASSCGGAIAALLSGARPACGTPGGTSFDVAAGTVNINTNTHTDYFVDEARTDTVTTTTRETYELTGTIVSVGTVHAAVRSGLYDLGGRFLRRVGEQGAAGLFGGEAEAPAEDGAALAPAGGAGGWAEGYGFRTRADARQGLPGERRDAWGLAAGLSFTAAPGLQLGFAADRGRLDLEMAAAGEQADVELTQIGAHARLDSGPFSLALAGTYGFGSVDSLRDFMGLAAGAYDVSLLGLFAEAAWRIEAGAWRIVPKLAVDHVRVKSDAFTETGALGLVVPAADSNRTRASAGLEIGRSFGAAPRGRVDLAGWARYSAVLDGAERRLPVAFAIAPGNPLVMRGLSERDSAEIGAQAALHMSRRFSLYVGYEARFAGGYDSHAGVAGLRIAW